MRLAKLCLITCLMAVILATFTRTFVLQPFHVPSTSMEPTLLVGDHLLVNKAIYRTAAQERWWASWLPSRAVKRGDVVVFQGQDRETQHRFVIKRCIGLPGETVELRSGQIFIDGRHLDESGYVHRDGRFVTESFGPIRLKEDELFVLGDHRASSRDSRAFGPLAETRLVGRAVLVYWSTRHTEVDPSGSWGKIGPLIKARFTQTRWRRTGTVVR